MKRIIIASVIAAIAYRLCKPKAEKNLGQYPIWKLRNRFFDEKR